MFEDKLDSAFTNSQSNKLTVEDKLSIATIVALMSIGKVRLPTLERAIVNESTIDESNNVGISISKAVYGIAKIVSSLDKETKIDVLSKAIDLLIKYVSKGELLKNKKISMTGKTRQKLPQIDEGLFADTGDLEKLIKFIVAEMYSKINFRDTAGIQSVLKKIIAGIFRESGVTASEILAKRGISNEPRHNADKIDFDKWAAQELKKAKDGNITVDFSDFEGGQRTTAATKMLEALKKLTNEPVKAKQADKTSVRYTTNTAKESQASNEQLLKYSNTLIKALNKTPASKTIKANINLEKYGNQSSGLMKKIIKVLNNNPDSEFTITGVESKKNGMYTITIDRFPALEDHN